MIPGNATTAPPTPRRAGWLLLLLLAGIIGITKLTSGGHTQPVFCADDKSPTADTVVMLSASWCGYCAQARKLFVKEGIDYCEYDIEQSAIGAARHRTLGARGVPVILVGNETLLGFDREAVLHALRARAVELPVRESPP